MSSRVCIYYYCYKDYKKECQETIDAQPQVLTENLVESQHMLKNLECSLPKQIRLSDTNEIMKCRKVKAVIRYHTPNKTKEPEKFFHHLLQLYYPWRDESKLLHSDSTYASKYYVCLPLPELPLSSYIVNYVMLLWATCA